MTEFGAAFYRARAVEMRKLADEAQTEGLRNSFLRLEASWARLAEQAEKANKPAQSETETNLDEMS